jgi:hypothetical protein
MELIDVSGEIGGHLKFDGNVGGTDGFFNSPVQILLAHGWLGIGGGVDIQGGLGAIGDTTLLVGDGGPLTLTGGLHLIQGARGMDAGDNTIDTANCDPLSYFLRFDDSSTIGTNNCPSDGPSGIKGEKGDTGAQRVQGIPGIQGEQGTQGIQGPPGGISGREVITNPLTLTVAKATNQPVFADCPAGKVAIGGGSATSNPSLAVISSLPTSATRWTVVFRNTANNNQTGTMTATAVCSVAQ